ncbi:PAS domain Sbox domain containing protein [Acanthamoeba castellanii str. Neff]|uniref:PAS domain Sbox domain containing protein n=1 Tax=Acanthamoeba castellanii (strain ATCC 30010 / Neff) TaxID=1257118 RepID=L8H0S9_ACACF|nr:PAS domain Sbox domain containing protein [Acanthamoeba castellanii str. Neff]ELR17976.1 PAS domain Sbox domain containing protein [Acanthamoeba castellanii str. Neff]
MEGKENKKEPTPNGDLSAAQPSAKRKRSIEADAPQHTAFASSPPSPMPQDEEENDDGSTSREGSSNGNGNENGNDEEEGHNARSKKVARLEARVAELEEENALYRCILETQEVLVVVLNTSGRIVRFNRACQAATGYCAEEAEGADLFDLLIPPDQTSDVRRVFDALHSEDDHERFVMPGQQWKNFWRTKDGRLILTRWRNDSVVATGVVIDAAPTAKDEFLLRRVVHTPSQSPAL